MVRILLLALTVFSLATRSRAEDTFFRKEVEPLLKDHCFECHSHEADKMKGGLTLDSQSGWQEGGESGPAIVPGHPDKSLLLTAISHRDPDLRMPKRKLSDAAIATLTEWIRRGAPDPRNAVPKRKEITTDWWSLRPLVRPRIPNSLDDSHPIDSFIRARLAKENLKPATTAERRVLIRRLSVTLRGLQPTPEEVDRFLIDPDPDAYPKLIRSHLASPHYGERWARHWLDTIHFADSHGCEHDVLRPNAWRFREYVVNRLNADVSWMNFIREQLAPEVFYPNNSSLLAGLGFIGAGPLELSRAGTAPVTFDYLDRDDMVTQTMAAFASTTANCARCHDHKFDPVSQEDYYSLQAVFAGLGKGDLAFDPDPTTHERRRDLQALQRAAEAKDPDLLLTPKIATLVEERAARINSAPVWTTYPLSKLASEGSTLERQSDGSIYSTGDRPDVDTYVLTGKPALEKVTGIRLDVLRDERLPHHGPGRQGNGNLHLNEIEVFLLQGESKQATRLNIKQASADWNQAGWTIHHALDGNLKTAWGIYPKVGLSHFAVFELAEPHALAPEDHIQVHLKQRHGEGHLIGRFKLSATNAADPASGLEILPMEILRLLQTAVADRNEADTLTLAASVAQAHARQQLETLPQQALVYGASPRHSHGKPLPQPLSKPKTVHVLHRGAIDKPGKEAHPGALAALTFRAGRFALDHPDQEATRRAALADWLADPDNPLTWRSIVNRVWHYHFGRGLCDTPNDFGRMGSLPSHPELLDWLACWFRDEAKGSLKELHFLILTSATYQQDSFHQNAEALKVDLDNRLLWRMNRRRLDADTIRDSVLQISGRLDSSVGGPAVEQFVKSKGPQSTPHLDYEAFDWSDPRGARRSIYRVVWRGIADPFMEALDFPDLALLSPKRSSSISSLQALALWNNSFVLHHCNVFESLLNAEKAPLEDKVSMAFRRTWLRDPTKAERAQLVPYAEAHGLAALARVLFNSNEFLHLD